MSYKFFRTSCLNGPADALLLKYHLDGINKVGIGMKMSERDMDRIRVPTHLEFQLSNIKKQSRK